MTLKRGTPFPSNMEIILVGVVAVAAVTTGAVGYWIHLCCTPREPVGYDPKWNRT